MSIRRNLILALLASLTLVVTGCPKEDDHGDGGTPDGSVSDGGTDGGTDGGGGPAEGETCDNPFELTSGVTANGDSTAALDDYGSACADSSAPSQPDLAYHFTVTEASGVEIVMNGFDGILTLFEGDCLTGSEVGACVDQAVDGEAISLGLVQPGEYFIVVDAWDGGGVFTLDLTLTPGGICVDDGLEGNGGNNTAASATNAGSADIDTTDLGDPNTPGPDPYPLNICGADVDVFMIGHFGGDITIDTAETAGTLTAEVLAAVIDPATGDVSEGASLGATPYTATGAARGYYLLKLSSSTPPVTGTEYSFSATHQCQGDADDSVLPEEDDEVYARAVYGFYDSPGAGAIERSLCLTDKDVYVLQNIAAGDITVNITGGASFVVTVEEVVDDGSGGKTTQAYGGTVNETVIGSDLEIAIPAAPVTELVLTLELPAAGNATELLYGLDATFAGLVSAPANDECAGAETLVAGDPAVALSGRTVGAGDHLVGPCGGEDVAVAAGKPGANDVFYHLNLAADTALEIAFDGSITRFYGQVYLLANPGGTCPADLSTLTPVNAGDGAPACRTGRSASLRFPSLTAGDYLLVVDGVYQEAFFIFPESWTEGGFSVSATTFAGGLPVPAACAAATALTLPASGASATETIDNTNAPNSLTSYGDCAGGGGGGNEVVYEITPAADATVTFTASGYDTILAIHEADCEFGTVVDCNDDNDPPGNYGSQLTATLTAGTTYFLIVDAWAADEVGTATLEIAVQ
ncbi:MAG: hypothetical protein P1V51_14710 [Deltaproteobacteria bacterium]|nr:hypothetical protein [Deltaproteobacteria bacterium]